jgi:hypothetical protein
MMGRFRKWRRARQAERVKVELRLAVAINGGRKLDEWEEGLYAGFLIYTAPRVKWSMTELVQGWALCFSMTEWLAFGDVLELAGEAGLPLDQVIRSAEVARRRVEGRAEIEGILDDWAAESSKWWDEA